MLPLTSTDSVRIISLNRNDLLARLREIAAHLKEKHPEVAEVRLFGSLARGDHTGISDADVLILLDHATESDPVRRVLTYLPEFELDRGVDPLVYTREELERLLSEGNLFLKKALKENILLG